VAVLLLSVRLLLLLAWVLLLLAWVLLPAAWVLPPQVLEPPHPLVATKPPHSPVSVAAELGGEAGEGHCWEEEEPSRRADRTFFSRPQVA
jgi:hypothetical protein